MTSDHLSEFGSRSTLSQKKLNMLPGMNDDAKSIISMQSNITGLSRKSAVSLLDLESITSFGDNKKLPGESGLRAAANRRIEKAKLAQIEANLKRIQKTEDLSYSTLQNEDQKMPDLPDAEREPGKID